MSPLHRSETAQDRQVFFLQEDKKTSRENILDRKVAAPKKLRGGGVQRESRNLQLSDVCIYTCRAGPSGVREAIHRQTASFDMYERKAGCLRAYISRMNSGCMKLLCPIAGELLAAAIETSWTRAA